MLCASPITAYIALGSNLGDRKRNISLAIDKLKATPGVKVVRISTLLENPAEGMGDEAPQFLNAAIHVETILSPRGLLEILMAIEQELGRNRSEKWAPRTIDMDLLLYGDQIIAGQELIIPHPLMHERRFVLEPLAEIAAEVVHPTLQMTIAGLLENVVVRND